YHSGFLALKRVLVETRGIEHEDLTDPLYAHWERDATDHLFSVAAGLDSMVLGETQIQRQVRESLRRAEAEEAAGLTTARAVHRAGGPGRRARQGARGGRPPAGASRRRPSARRPTPTSRSERIWRAKRWAGSPGGGRS